MYEVLGCMMNNGTCESRLKCMLTILWDKWEIFFCKYAFQGVGV